MGTVLLLPNQEAEEPSPRLKLKEYRLDGIVIDINVKKRRMEWAETLGK